jgi:hypothetical protein
MIMAAADLLERPYLRPVYDEPEFVVRTVWRLYGGWYDGNPAHLWEHPPVESAERRSNGDGQEEETMLYEPHQEATRIWEDVLERVADRIDDSSRRVWFEGVCAVGLESDALIVAVPNAFAEEYITTRFKEIVDEGLRSLLSPPAEMRLVIGKVAPLT